ncbi:sensor domain-containing diguanylate cyclase [Sulfurimonas sp. SAG-AH-194-L11]|nr:sensor domain-containing diguanylate cyclase [Sulfurimonas sp. SAG-AH-194-L11]MDF1877024.1 sensor domain-containing diguanylate cyclase [Sulfurimonas sp. SAG-AH-194-L11]
MNQCDTSFFTEIIKISINEIYIFDSKSFKFIFVNDAAALNMGYSKDEFLDLEVATIKPAYTFKEFSNYIQPLLEGSVAFLTFETLHQRKDGSVYNIDIQLQCILSNTKKVCIAVGRDITDRVKKHQNLMELATIDSLTKTYNRYQINAEIENEIIRVQRTDRRFSLMMIDLDYFKKVNDTFGHDIGDEVLIEFTRVLKKSLRKNDKIGRWGGEEFMVLLVETSLKDALSVSQKLCQDIDRYKFKSIGHLTCSIGVSLFKRGDTKFTLLKRIDQALYLSKNTGRNRVSILE